jgi:HK97 family phage major capsid protein
MSYEDRDLGSLVAEIQKASANLERGDTRTNERIDQIETSLNDLFRRVGRPALSYADGDDALERKSAAELCIIKHALDQPKDTGAKAEYWPGSSEIDSAILHRKALRLLLRHGDPTRLEPEFRKSLTSFSFGTNQFILPTEMSSRVLSCLADPTDLTGLVSNESISGASIKFPIDKVRMSMSSWACETACFANNPLPDLQGGLGELEIKADSIRHVICAGKDLLEDSAFNIEAWLMRKAAAGYRAALSEAIIAGDGNGKPLGLLSARGGVPVCETAAATAAGSLTWQDLVMLKWELPMQWQAGAVYLMNQRTFAQIMTMSDATHRPIWTQMPGSEPGFQLAGSPIVIATQFPDIAPGSTPIFFGNLRECYTLVTRRALTLQPDPYSAQWCMLFRFDARIGGAPLCPNAGRLLRIR